MSVLITHKRREFDELTETERAAEGANMCVLCDDARAMGDYCAEHAIREIARVLRESYTPIPWSGCWLWDGRLDAGGYGYFNFGGARLRAHRMAWAMANGRPISDKMHICHACDEPSCVNPAHLHEGTPHQNTMDSVTKLRRHRTLTEEKVKRIYSLSARGVFTVPDIARIVRVNTTIVYKILRGEIWDFGVRAKGIDKATATVKKFETGGRCA